MKDTLNARFRAPLPDYYRRRIIVWKDEAGEFADTVADLHLENARVLTMRPNALFELRRQIEVDFADEDLLLYCPMAFERPEDNWLLDVFLYSEEFRADYWSLLFAELNIENTRPVREYAKTVSAFFASKERRARLHVLREKYANERELQTGIFGVLCGAKTYGFAEVVKQVLSCAPEDEPAAMNAMAKFCGENAFWNACEEVYGYAGAPEELRLTAYLLATAALNVSGASALPGLPSNGAYAVQAYGFFAGWFHADRETLMALCQRVEDAFDVSALLKRLSRDALLTMVVFPAADRLLLENALNSFAEGCFSLDDAETLLRARRDQPWAKEYVPYYGAVRALIDMQRFYLAYRGGFHAAEPKELWTAYVRELYRMDQHYRAFCTCYDQALSLGMMALEDALKAAADAVERLYKNWYLTELNLTWTQLLSSQGLGALTGVARQQDFYQQNVVPMDSRVYVVISDAFRYETAQELTAQMTGKFSGNTECSCMAGLLPGVTSVGMAALLPHRALEMDDQLNVLCDGRSTEAPDREAVLHAACAESAAVDYFRFRQCNRAQRSELVKGKKVVYLYHNTIDRIGESDGNVFEACTGAMDELMQLMRILTNELNAATVLITADHGFLYTRSPMEEYEKTGKEILTGEILKYKRRHAILRGQSTDPGSVSMPLDAFGRSDLMAVFPNGCMRFRLQGGNSAYLHGGPSLQEMAVPLIRYQNRKAGQKGFTAITKVDLILLGENRKISNNIFSLNFYQKQPCIGKVQPRTVTARFEDSGGKAVSDEHRLLCDMTAPENDQRVLRTTFRLLGSGYDRSAEYWLVLRDEEAKCDLERIPFHIDIVFENDFDF